jgi:hypothetical protein
MSTNHRNGELDGLIRQLDEIAADARQVFGGLSAEQLNWKPAPEQWSVGQCFEHLIVTGQFFLRTLDKILAGERQSSAWEKWSPLSGFFGRMIIGAMQPDARRKFKAPARVRPASSAVGADVLEGFADGQRRLAERMRATGKMDVEKLIITSPIARFVTYNLMDAYRIVVTHERRHFEQARRVTEAEGFPRASASADMATVGVGRG